MLTTAKMQSLVAQRGETLKREAYARRAGHRLVNGYRWAVHSADGTRRVTQPTARAAYAAWLNLSVPQS